MNIVGTTKSVLTAGLLAGFMMTLSTTFTGCLTDDSKDTGKAVVDSNKSTPFGAQIKLDVGAQGHATLGTAVDLDAKKVLTSGPANLVQSTIDILFIYSDGELQIASPVAAKAAGDVPLAKNYDSAKIKDTQFAKLSTLPYDSEAAINIFQGTPKLNIALAIEGDKFLVKTGEGKLVSLEITSVTGSDNAATAVLTMAFSGL